MLATQFDDQEKRVLQYLLQGKGGTVSKRKGALIFGIFWRWLDTPDAMSICFCISFLALTLVIFIGAVQ